uniref:SAM domain-containing protein n=1 Tax=Haemonchus contortus TaxID=6289 RepID=A0A7I5EEJ0_HAECO
MLEDVKARARGYKLFGGELFRELQEEGIESMDDWNEYAKVTERDGELFAEICDVQTNVSHIRVCLASFPEMGKEDDLGPERGRKVETDDSGESRDTMNRMGHTSSRNESVQGPSRRQISQTGAPCGQGWRQRSEPSEEAIGTSGQDLLNVMALIQANAFVSPGVFKGNSHDNFKEFMRRFARKYRTVIFDEKTLLDIMVDAHLEGGAKTVFLSLPSSVREQGFDAVVRELRKLLANDSTAGRLRALTELRSLERRWDQTVTDFCVVLEKLGRQANSACSMKDKSLEHAQILLDNSTGWPEHVHLLSTLHRVKPTGAYDAVKERASTIEQLSI